MKTTVLIVVCVLMLTEAFAQNQNINQMDVTAPRFTGIYNSANEFLSNNIEYPPEMKYAGIQGTEVIQFVVTPKGELKDFTQINRADYAKKPAPMIKFQP